MNRILCTLLVLGAGSVGLVGQTLKTAPTKTNPPFWGTDQEKNIRAYIELLRSNPRKDRFQLVDSVMQLDAQDATKFWPIYNDFITEYVQLGDNILALIKRYAATLATMTNQAADQLATRLLDLEEARSSRKRKYYWKVKDALGATMAARFIQAESQLDRIIDLQSYSELPAIEGLRRRHP